MSDAEKIWLVQVEIPCLFIAEVKAATREEAMDLACKADALDWAELVKTCYHEATALDAEEEPE